MATSVAHGAKLVSVGSHSVRIEHGQVTREECYPVLTVIWRNQEISAQVECSRYVAQDFTACAMCRDEWPARGECKACGGKGGTSSPVLTDWRMFAQRCEPSVSDTARLAINQAVEPVVTDWLDSDGYKRSRQGAFVFALRRIIRDSTYGISGALSTYKLVKDELPLNERTRLISALRGLESVLADTEGEILYDAKEGRQ